MTTNYNDEALIDKYITSPLVRDVVEYPAIKKIFSCYKNKKILDLGCGEGYVTNLLSSLGADCTGIDISHKFIKIAKKKYPRQQFYPMDGRNLSALNNNNFDAVIMLMVLPNVADLETLKLIFKSCAKLLKQNGKLFISTVHPDMIVNKISDEIRQVKIDHKNIGIGDDFSVSTLLSDYQNQICFNNKNWPITFMSDLLSDEGFVLNKKLSPKPCVDLIKKPYRKKYARLLSESPYYIFLEYILR